MQNQGAYHNGSGALMVVSVIAERVPFWNPTAAAHLAGVIADSDRTVIQVYYYRLKGPRPPAKAGSDARSVIWLPKSEIVSSKMAFDHGFAVRELLQL